MLRIRRIAMPVMAITKSPFSVRDESIRDVGDECDVARAVDLLPRTILFSRKHSDQSTRISFGWNTPNNIDSR